MSSNAFSRCIADAFEVSSFDETKKIQGKRTHMVVGDPGGPPSPVAGRKRKKPLPTDNRPKKRK